MFYFRKFLQGNGGYMTNAGQVAGGEVGSEGHTTASSGCLFSWALQNTEMFCG